MEKRDENERACFVHDPNGHWHDDMSYISENEPIPEGARRPVWAELVKKLSEYLPGDTELDRFTLVYVKTDTRMIDIVGNPGSSPLTVINLLSRAASIIAFQEAKLQDDDATATMKTILGRLLSSRDDIEPESGVEDVPGLGQYLLALLRTLP